MFKFRDVNSKGEVEVYYECENPAFIIDSERYYRIKYGNYEELLELMPIYGAIGCLLVEAPKDQGILDQLFQGSLFFNKYYEKIIRGLN